MTNRLRVQSNERVDLSDFQHVAAQAEASSRALHSEVFTDPDKTRTWILEGFAMSNPAAKQVQVDLGRAILSKRVGGATQYGVLTVSGDATKIVDLNTYAPGTYGVYVRFEEVESEAASRIFWDPAGDGSEYTQSIATRYVANWSVRVESSNPGSEWTKLGEVDQATMAFTDQRNFYFEGQIDDTYESGWSTDGGGGANDRNADRAQYGVFDFQTSNAAVRQSLEDIKGRGLRRWWARDIGGMNLGFDAAPVEDRLAIGDANHYLEKTGGTVAWQWDANTAILDAGVGVTFKTNGANQADIDNTGLILRLTNGITYATNDYQTYDRTSNIFQWYINSGLEMTVAASGGRIYGNWMVNDVLEVVSATDGTLLLHDSAGTADYKISAIWQGSDVLTIGEATDLKVIGNEYLTFTRDAAGMLDELLIGNAAGTDTPVVRPYDNSHNVALGASGYRFGTSYGTTWDMGNLVLHADGVSAYGRIEFNERVGVSDAGLFKIYGNGGVFSIYSYKWSDPGSGYAIPFFMTLDTGGATVWKVAKAEFSVVNHLVLDGDSSDYPGFAIKADTGGVTTIGLVNYVVYTGHYPTKGGSTVRTVQGASAISNSGYLKFFIGTTPYYLPYYAAV